MKELTLDKTKEIMNKLHINSNVITANHFKNAMKVELEHGLINKRTNVTHNDYLKTGKIALAHLLEMPDYYKRLNKLEKEGNAYWKNKTKPTIIKNIKNINNNNKKNNNNNNNKNNNNKNNNNKN